MKILSQLAPPSRLDLNSLQISSGPPSPTPSTTSFISSISWMADKTSSELIPLLKNAYSALKEKEKDLVLAAELGASLLEHNMKLKSSYDSLLKLSTPPITPSSSMNTTQESEEDEDSSMCFIPSKVAREAMMEVLESKNTELSTKLEEAMNERDAVSRINNKKTRQLENEIDLLKSNLDIALAKIQELQEINQRQKKLESTSITQTVKNPETEELVEDLYAEIDKIVEERDMVLQSKADLESKLADTLKDLSELKKQFEKFEFTQHDFNELQEAYQRQFNHIDELNHSLEDHRTILQKLKEKGVNIQSSPTPSTTGDSTETDSPRKNTLLQELEDEWLKSKSLVTDKSASIISSCIDQMRDLNELKEKSLQAFYQVPSVGLESVLSKATGIDQQLLDEALDFIDKIEQEHNVEKCLTLYQNFIDNEEFNVDEDQDYPCSDLYPKYKCMQLQTYVETTQSTFIGRLKNQLRKLFHAILKWCRFAIVLTTALLINAWRGPESLLLTL